MDIFWNYTLHKVYYNTIVFLKTKNPVEPKNKITILQQQSELPITTGRSDVLSGNKFGNYAENAYRNPNVNTRVNKSTSLDYSST